MPDYEAEKIRIDEFIRTFEDPALDNDDAIHNKFKYMRQLVSTHFSRLRHNSLSIVSCC